MSYGQEETAVEEQSIPVTSIPLTVEAVTEKPVFAEDVTKAPEIVDVPLRTIYFRRTSVVCILNNTF